MWPGFARPEGSFSCPSSHSGRSPHSSHARGRRFETRRAHWKRPDSGAKLAGAPCPMVPNRRPPREPSGARCPSPQVHYSSEYDEPSDVDRAVAGHPVLGEVARRIADELLDVLTHEPDRPFGVTSAPVHDTGDVRHHAAKLLFAGPQLRFDALLAGDVDAGALQAGPRSSPTGAGRTSLWIQTTVPSRASRRYSVSEGRSLSRASACAASALPRSLDGRAPRTSRAR
jgi:hypothetical protein